MTIVPINAHKNLKGFKMNTSFYLLAQEDAQPVVSEPVDAPETENITTQDGAVPADPNGPGATRQSPFNTQLIFLVLMIVVIYFLMFRGPKQKQKKHQNMINELAKNDKVRTIGGMIGTVVDIRDNEVILKVDESTNTKIRVIKGAIATTLKDEIEK